MPDSMPGTRRVRHYRPVSRKAGRVAQAVALRTGNKPATCEQWLHGHSPIDERIAVWLEEAIRHEDWTLSKRIMDRIEAAVITAGGELYAAKVLYLRQLFAALTGEKADA